MQTFSSHPSTGHQYMQWIWLVMWQHILKQGNHNWLQKCGEKGVKARTRHYSNSVLAICCQVKHVKELSPVLMSQRFTDQDLIHQLIATYIVGDRFHDGKKSGHKKETCYMDNCFELKSYKSVMSKVINRLQSRFHYFTYNQLMDYWHKKKIVQMQFQAMQSKKKPHKTVTRGHLHRFIYSQS